MDRVAAGIGPAMTGPWDGKDVEKRVREMREQYLRDIEDARVKRVAQLKADLSRALTAWRDTGGLIEAVTDAAMNIACFEVARTEHKA